MHMYVQATHTQMHTCTRKHMHNTVTRTDNTTASAPFTVRGSQTPTHILGIKWPKSQSPSEVRQSREVNTNVTSAQQLILTDALICPASE